MPTRWERPTINRAWTFGASADGSRFDWDSHPAGASFGATQAWTIEALWFTPAAASDTHFEEFLTVGLTSNAGTGLTMGLEPSSATLKNGYLSNELGNSVNTGVAAPLGSWNYLAATFDNTTYRTFFAYPAQSNVRAGSTTTTATIPLQNLSAGMTVSVGANRNGNSWFFGSLAYIRIWNRALLISELQRYKNFHLPPIPHWRGLIFHWDASLSLQYDNPYNGFDLATFLRGTGHQGTVIPYPITGPGFLRPFNEMGADQPPDRTLAPETGGGSQTLSAAGAFITPVPLLGAAAVEEFDAAASLTTAAVLMAAAEAEYAAAGALTTTVVQLTSVASELFASAAALALPAPTLSAAAVETFSASAALATPLPLLTATAQEQAAAGALLLPVPTLAASAAETFAASGALVLPLPQLASAAQEQTAAGALALPRPQLAASAAETFSAGGAFTTPAPSLAAAAQEQAATGSLILAAPLLAASAVQTFSASGALVTVVPLVNGTEREQAAAGSLTLPMPQLAAAATETFSAAAALLLPAGVLAATGLEQTAAAALTLPAAQLAAGAIETFMASGVFTTPPVSLAAAAAETFTAAGALTLPPPLLAASATFTPASGASAAGALVLPVPLLAAAAREQAAAGALALSVPQLAAGVVETFSASGSLLLPAPVLAGAATETFVAAGVLVLPVPLLSGGASFTPAAGATASAALTLPIAQLGAAAREQTAAGALTLSTVTLAGAAVEAFTAAGAFTTPAPILTGTGSLTPITVAAPTTIRHGARGVAGWLYATLSADPTLTTLLPGGVHERVVPQRARLVASQPLALRPRGGSNPVVPELVDRYPVLVYALLEAKDVRPARKPYVYTTCRYAVTVIDRAESFAAAAAAMDRVDALLDNQTGTAPTGEAILYCQREEQIDQDHIITGVNYRETGSVFRVKVQ